MHLALCGEAEPGRQLFPVQLSLLNERSNLHAAGTVSVGCSGSECFDFDNDRLGRHGIDVVERRTREMLSTEAVIQRDLEADPPLAHIRVEQSPSSTDEQHHHVHGLRCVICLEATSCSGVFVTCTLTLHLNPVVQPEPGVAYHSIMLTVGSSVDLDLGSVAQPEPSVACHFITYNAGLSANLDLGSVAWPEALVLHCTLFYTLRCVASLLHGLSVAWLGPITALHLILRAAGSVAWTLKTAASRPPLAGTPA